MLLDLSVWVLRHYRLSSSLSGETFGDLGTVLRSCCHTSSCEGADGFCTWRSVMIIGGIEVFHSIETMLRKPHKEVADRSQELYWYEEVRPKV